MGARRAGLHLLLALMSDPLIRVSHLFKSVQDSSGTLDILRDIDFTLNARETAAIVGASGSGKSTLLSIMAGLDTPSRGTVWLAGQDLFTLDEDARAQWRARHLGFVFQSFQLLSHLTALENVMLPLELSGVAGARSAAREILERVGLGQRLNHTPRVLSGGEQQRVSVSVWPWHALLWCSPIFCWLTSPLAVWTMPQGPRSWT
ncbi:MAG: hypothetical protein RJA29_533 [Pseudomonadota bacterium]